MADAKHTPGPWSIYSENPPCNAQWYPGFTIHSNGYRIADTAILNDDHAANACLIATAPDLLEKLKVAKGHIEHMGRFIGAQKAGYSFEGICEDMPGIDAAIAKATGAA